MGLSFSIRPVNDLVWVNDFYIDDLGFNELIKFDFDAKNSYPLQLYINFD